MTVVRRSGRVVLRAIGVALLVSACTGDGAETRDLSPGDATTASVTADTDPPADTVGAEVLATFATYRAGAAQGDAAAVLGSLSAASLEDQARLADLARTASESEVRALQAADQLVILTYRLRPELLDAEDPFAALVAAQMVGVDRTLGELGDVELVNEDLAVGVVLANGTLAPTPLRWQFVREDGSWRFDLVDAHRLVSRAVADTARRQGVGLPDLVAGTIADLSGAPPATVAQLFSERPGS